MKGPESVHPIIRSGFGYDARSLESGVRTGHSEKGAGQGPTIPLAPAAVRLTPPLEGSTFLSFFTELSAYNDNGVEYRTPLACPSCQAAAVDECD